MAFGTQVVSTFGSRRAVLPLMPRQARVAPGGLVYHVLNRAVARLPLLQKPEDYDAFERVLDVRTTANAAATVLKPNVGHLLAGSGLIETIGALLAVRHQVVPATLNTRPEHANFPIPHPSPTLAAQEWGTRAAYALRCGQDCPTGFPFWVLPRSHGPKGARIAAVAVKAVC